MAAYLRENESQLNAKDFDFSATTAGRKREAVPAKSFTRPVSAMSETVDNQIPCTVR